ncbi:hypothetical protein GOP47_0029252 [Adiantum capillus-veneris]|nr:hypothetical protein GOP47_0029252 [Adiantum capillus-veneris]
MVCLHDSSSSSNTAVPSSNDHKATYGCKHELLVQKLNISITMVCMRAWVPSFTFLRSRLSTLTSALRKATGSSYLYGYGDFFSCLSLPLLLAMTAPWKHHLRRL